MLKGLSARSRAILQALLVTFLWSSSYILIKIGLASIPPLTFAGLRYTIAFLCLLPMAMRSSRPLRLKAVSARNWLKLVLLGVVYYAVTQGAQFLSLLYLPAVTISLVLSFTSIIVALLGIVFLGERPSAAQWLGTALYLAGVLVYFSLTDLTPGQPIGLLIALAGLLANAISAVLGRHVNRQSELDPLLVTLVSMGTGAALLLITGICTQGMPRLSLTNWTIIVWLAVVNSAVAFLLWNRTLRVLTAMESSIINNTMLFQIALLAWITFGDKLQGHEMLGMVIASAGTLVVQLAGRADTARR